MPPAGTTELLQALRAQLLAFIPLGGGGTLATRLSDIHMMAPDDATYPYGVLQVHWLDTDLAGGFEQAGLFELMLYDQFLGQLPALIAAGDVAMEALTTWKTTSVGFLSVLGGVRHDGLPREQDPAMSGLLVRRVTADVLAHPEHLTQYAVQAG